MATSDNLRPDTDRPEATSRQQYCDIGPRQIPIVMEDRLGQSMGGAFHWFRGDESGEHEPRRYAFWSVLAGPVSLMVFRLENGRAMEGELGDRARMTLRQIDLLQKFADRVMPATVDEVNLWLESHPAQASFVISEEPFPASDE